MIIDSNVTLVHYGPTGSKEGWTKEMRGTGHGDSSGNWRTTGTWQAPALETPGHGYIAETTSWTTTPAPKEPCTGRRGFLKSGPGRKQTQSTPTQTLRFSDSQIWNNVFQGCFNNVSCSFWRSLVILSRSTGPDLSTFWKFQKWPKQFCDMSGMID